MEFSQARGNLWLTTLPHIWPGNRIHRETVARTIRAVSNPKAAQMSAN